MGKKEDWIWLAGLFDGEGCISIVRMGPSERGKNNRHQLKLTVSMICEKTVKKFHEIVGTGRVVRTSRKGKNCRDQWVWQVESKKARNILERLKPYCLTKNEQLLLGIEFYDKFFEKEGYGRERVPKEIIKERDDYYWKMRGLKWGEEIGKEVQ